MVDVMTMRDAASITRDQDQRRLDVTFLTHISLSVS
jgi:hypothetical protein